MKKRGLAILLSTLLLGTAVLGGCGQAGAGTGNGAAGESGAASSGAGGAGDAAAGESGTAASGTGGTGDTAAGAGGAETAAVDTSGFRYHELSRERETPMGESGTWTIFVYLCGSNLETEQCSATLNLLQMIFAAPAEHLNIVVQTGGAQRWGDTETWAQNASQEVVDLFLGAYGTNEQELATKQIDASKLQRYLVTDTLELVDEQPLASMGDSETLYEFLHWGIENYPAENMGVVLWDHGGGSLLGACMDENFGGDILYPFQISEAFERLYPEMTDRFAFVGFDACLMATVELANILAPHARYLYASEEVEPGFGWDYEPLITAINENPQIGADELGTALCQGYMELYQAFEMAEQVTLSVTDLSKIDPVLAALDGLTESMDRLTQEPEYLGPVFRETARAEDYENGMVDLGDLAANLGTLMPDEGAALEKAVADAVVCSVSGQARSFATGLSVYYPKEPSSSGVLYYEYSAPTDTYAAYIRDLQTEQFRQQLSEKSLVKITGEPSEEADGTYRMDIDPSTLDYVREVGHMLYANQDGEYCTYLGSSNNLDIDFESGAVRDNFDGTWAYLGDAPLLLNLDEYFDEYAIYLSPILLNGERTNLILQWTVDETEENGGHFDILGTYSGLDPQTGMASRQMRGLREGDVVQPMYLLLEDEVVFSEEEVYIPEEEREYTPGDEIVIGKEPQVERRRLTLGNEYLYQFYVIDIYGKQQTYVPTTMAMPEEAESAA